MTSNSSYTCLLFALCVSLAAPARAGEIVGLGDLPGGAFQSVAAGVNADGTVVVGRSYSANGAQEAFRWTRAGGMIGLGDLAGGSFSSDAYGVNADGSVVVGRGHGVNGHEAFRWTQAGGMIGLGDLAGGSFYSVAYGVNADGSVVVGVGNAAAGQEAFRWTQAGGMVGLGDLAGGTHSSIAYGVSTDGSVVVGFSSSANGAQEAFRWTQAGGMVGLGDLAGGLFTSVAYGVNADGSVVVGNGISAAGREAFRWTQAGGMVGLGDLAGGTFESEAKAVNADGSVVVGYGNTAVGKEAMRWTPAAGMQTITQWLADNGVSIAPGFTRLVEATGVSNDGTVVVGTGNSASGTEAFLARASSGVIGLNAFAQSLGELGSAGALALSGGSLLMNGAHGDPLARRVRDGQNCAWAAGDLGRDDHGGRDGSVGLAELGGCHNFGPFQLNLSVGNTRAEQALGNGGDITLNGQYLMAEALLPLKNKLWASLGAFYHDGEADIVRGYLNAGRVDRSRGSPDVETWGVRARIELDEAARIGSFDLSPYTDLGHVSSRQAAYTETGGGFPARFDASTGEATELRLGVNASKPTAPGTRLLGKLEGVHRFQQAGAHVSGDVIGLFSFNFNAPNIKQNWLRGGLGMEYATDSHRFNLMVNVTTEGDAPSAWLAASYQMSF